MSEDEKAFSRALGGGNDMGSYNEDYELKKLLKRYLNDQTEENLKMVEEGMKKESMIPVFTLSEDIYDYVNSKESLDEEETKRIIHIQNIMKEKMNSKGPSNDVYNEKLGAFESDTKKHL